MNGIWKRKFSANSESGREAEKCNAESDVGVARSGVDFYKLFIQINYSARFGTSMRSPDRHVDSLRSLLRIIDGL
jgi:hypothetical protein